MTKTEIKTWLAAGGVSALALAGGWFGVMSPQMTARGLSQDNEAAARAQVDALSAQIADLKTKSDKITEAVDAMRDLSAKFPSDFKQGAWLPMIKQAADRAGVTDLILSPTTPVDAAAAADPAAVSTPPATPAPTTDPASGTPVAPPAAPTSSSISVSTVSINAQGTFRQVQRFVVELENLARPILLSSVTITQSPEGTASLAVTGRTFLIRDLEQPPALPASD